MLTRERSPNLLTIVFLKNNLNCGGNVFVDGEIYRLVNNNRPCPSYQYDLHSKFSSSDDATIDDVQDRKPLNRKNIAHLI